MSVMVIDGSLHDKGNADLLCDTLGRGASDAGHTIENSLCPA